MQFVIQHPRKPTWFFDCAVWREGFYVAIGDWFHFGYHRAYGWWKWDNRF